MVMLESAPTQTTTLTRSINAPIAQVYAAFTERDGVRDWLADDAHLRAGTGGHLLLVWQGNRHAVGSYTAVEKNARVAFTLPEGNSEQVIEAFMEAEGEGTRLTLNISGADDTLRQEWENRLDTLKMALEDGQDLRITGRVIIGIFPDDLTEETAARLGVPVKEGTRVGGLVPGYSAAAAGLQVDDVVTSINGLPVNDNTPIGAQVRDKRPGDTVEVTFYRGGEKHVVPVNLKGYPVPERAADFADLASRIEGIYAEFDRDAAGLFADYTAQEAGHRPGEKEWSANEVLAHLVMSERWLHNWLGTLMQTPEADGFGANSPARIAAVMSLHPTTDDLLAELRRAHAETIAIVRNVPAEVGAQKNILWWMAFEIDTMMTHGRNHFDQIRAALTKARG